MEFLSRAAVTTPPLLSQWERDVRAARSLDLALNLPPPLLSQRERGSGGEGLATVEVHPIEPAAVDSAIGHAGDPRALLALTKALYGRCPVAWSIAVPASSFAFGAGLSPAAERGLTVALQQIRELIDVQDKALIEPGSLYNLR